MKRRRADENTANIVWLCRRLRARSILSAGLPFLSDLKFKLLYILFRINVFTFHTTFQQTATYALYSKLNLTVTVYKLTSSGSKCKSLHNFWIPSGPIISGSSERNEMLHTISWGLIVPSAFISVFCAYICENKAKQNKALQLYLHIPQTKLCTFSLKMVLKYHLSYDWFHLNKDNNKKELKIVIIGIS